MSAKVSCTILKTSRGGDPRLSSAGGGPQGGRRQTAPNGVLRPGPPCLSYSQKSASRFRTGLRGSTASLHLPARPIGANESLPPHPR
jgi:hypothetical protein